VGHGDPVSDRAVKSFVGDYVPQEASITDSADEKEIEKIYEKYEKKKLKKNLDSDKGNQK
jgi:hypothetical protein